MKSIFALVTLLALCHMQRSAALRLRGTSKVIPSLNWNKGIEEDQAVVIDQLKTYQSLLRQDSSDSSGNLAQELLDQETSLEVTKANLQRQLKLAKLANASASQVAAIEQLLAQVKAALSVRDTVSKTISNLLPLFN